MQHAFRGSRRLFAFLSACALILAAFAAGASAHSVAKQKSHHRHGHHHGNGGVTIDNGVSWGTVPGPGGGSASLYTLTNSNGMTVKITNYGGVVQSIWVPDKRGRSTDVALGFSSLSDYVNDFTQGHTGTPWPAPGGSGDTFFGAIIGRYANRIANASFPLNGTTYTLDANNGPNTLHGGFLGWNTVVWSAATSTSPGSASLELTHTFLAGEGCDRTGATPCSGTGFPADVRATVVYTLTKDNQLKITYTAINGSGTDDTVINLTNHSYFNLGGESSGTVENQLLQINSDQYTPVDANLIPEAPYFVNVRGTAYDFRHLTPIGENIRNTNLPDGFAAPAGQLKQLQIAHGYDNNWVLNGYPGYRLVSTAVDPKNGIFLKTFTDQPGVQFYSSNFLVGDLIGTSGNVYRQTQGFTLETQHYPDSPHHQGDPQWPSVVLPHGGTFNSVTSYQLGTVGGDHGHHQHHRH